MKDFFNALDKLAMQNKKKKKPKTCLHLCAFDGMGWCKVLGAHKRVGYVSMSVVVDLMPLL